jgi:hypothetical protein
MPCVEAKLIEETPESVLNLSPQRRCQFQDAGTVGFLDLSNTQWWEMLGRHGIEGLMGQFVEIEFSNECFEQLCIIYQIT